MNYERTTLSIKHASIDKEKTQNKVIVKLLGGNRGLSNGSNISTFQEKASIRFLGRGATGCCHVYLNAIVNHDVHIFIKALQVETRLVWLGQRERISDGLTKMIPSSLVRGCS